MRELKFRVWDKANNRYLRRDSTGIDNLGNIIDFENCDEDDWGVHNVRILGKNDMGFTTEQYTGLHDKNGRKIYKGDIVAEHNGDIIGTIVQHPSGEWQIAWVGIFGGVSKLYNHRDWCEVIGDIHNNPELLER